MRSITSKAICTLLITALVLGTLSHYDKQRISTRLLNIPITMQILCYYLVLDYVRYCVRYAYERQLLHIIKMQGGASCLYMIAQNFIAVKDFFKKY